MNCKDKGTKEDKDVREVKELIDSLIEMKNNHSPLLLTIYDFNLVIEGLNELDNMIEMYDVKKSIVSQIKFLLVNNEGEKLDGHMAHTVLSGVPGVGKTVTGIILAKIWTGLGLLKNNNERRSSSPNSPYTSTESEEKDKDEREGKDKDEILSLEKQVNNLTSINRMKTNIVKKLQEHVSTLKKETKDGNLKIILNNYKLKTLRRELHKKQSNFYSICETTIEDILKINDEIEKSNNNILNNTISDEHVSFTINVPIPSFVPISNVGIELEKLKIISKNLDKKIKLTKSLSEPSISDRRSEDLNPKNFGLIRIVSREDFVAGFLGQTAIKTERLLRDSLGKVLFIDEAYSLVHDDKDSYGKEALTCLNLFMSQHSSEIIVIFAGYKELMQETIFKYQPGLRRRCSWNFEIKGYTENGLAKIFEKQLNKSGWILDEDVNLVEFFKENLDDFPSFGGDTLRLSFYCKICYANVIFDENLLNTKTINKEVLHCALKYLKEHKLTNKEETKYPQMYV